MHTLKTNNFFFFDYWGMVECKDMSCMCTLQVLGANHLKTCLLFTFLNWIWICENLTWTVNTQPNFPSIPIALSTYSCAVRMPKWSPHCHSVWAYYCRCYFSKLSCKFVTTGSGHINILLYIWFPLSYKWNVSYLSSQCIGDLNSVKPGDISGQMCGQNQAHTLLMKQVLWVMPSFAAHWEAQHSVLPQPLLPVCHPPTAAMEMIDDKASLAISHFRMSLSWIWWRNCRLKLHIFCH